MRALFATVLISIGMVTGLVGAIIYSTYEVMRYSDAA